MKWKEVFEERTLKLITERKCPRNEGDRFLLKN